MVQALCLVTISGDLLQTVWASGSLWVQSWGKWIPPWVLGTFKEEIRKPNVLGKHLPPTNRVSDLSMTSKVPSSRGFRTNVTGLKTKHGKYVGLQGLTETKAQVTSGHARCRPKELGEQYFVHRCSWFQVSKRKDHLSYTWDLVNGVSVVKCWYLYSSLNPTYLHFHMPRRIEKRI